MKSSYCFLILAVVVILSLPVVAPADSGSQLRRVDTTPEIAPQPPSPPEGAQLRRVRASVDRGSLPDLRTDEGKEELIRRSYATVSLYSLASGHSPTFELSDFRTLQRIDFGSFRWFDLVTPPGGWVVQVTRHTARGAQGQPIRRHYTPQWAPAPQDYLQSAEGKRFANARIDEVLAEGAREQPQLLGVTSITTYRVTVSLDEESRSYRAAFLWTETGAGLTYQAYDQVTGRVDEALTEKVPTGPVRPETPLLDDGVRSVSGAFGTCLAEDVANQGFSLGAADFQGHTSGQHELTGSFSASCHCFSDCSQTCTPNVNGSCSEWGETDTCHKISNASEDSQGSTVFDGSSAGSTATCGGGAACAWQACSLCFCSPSVSVSWGGFGLSVSASSGAATLQNSHSYTCPPCNLEQEEPTDDGETGGTTTSGGGGGGGGDGGGGGCCDCDGDGWVTIEECEEACGGIVDLANDTCWVN